jgi:N6-L-threonylcarbamoyladenine synthase
LQHTIIDILLEKLVLASKHMNIREIAIAGGVSANSGLRQRLLNEGEKRNWNVYIPKFEYCTDNGAMIAITGYYQYRAGNFVDQRIAATARWAVGSKE